MKSNNLRVSCHVFVDDVQAIQAIPFNRNAWHAGDGVDGTGNRRSIGVEICYSTDYSTDRHDKAFNNAAVIVKQLMDQFSIPIENVVQHNHWTGKDCPHRIRKEGTWQRFLSLCQEGNKAMGFKDGYQTYTWLNQRIHVYKQSGKEKLSVYALPYGETIDITKVHIPGKKIKCIVSGVNYFDMEGKTYGIFGGYQGLNCNAATIGKGEENFKGYNGTDDKPYTDLAVLKDGTIKYGDFNSWDYRGDDVEFRVSPAGVQMDNGENKSWYSPEVGYGKITTANNQTLLLKCDDGKFALAVVSGRLSLIQCRSFSRNYGCTHQSGYDSGGSSQMVVNAEKKFYTGRDCPIFFVIYEEENEVSDNQNEATEEVTPSSEITFRMVKCVKGTLQGGTKYPTRPNINSNYSTTSYLINVGDVLQFDDAGVIQGRPDCFFKISGGTRPDLIGRWFAYDKDYFD